MSIGRNPNADARPPNKTLEHNFSIFAAPHFRSSSWRYGARRIRCGYSGFEIIAGLNKPTSGSIVVQRYGADTVTFGWPKQRADSSLREQLAFNLSKALKWVRTPELLILDEPLAGLDWKARADVRVGVIG
ncbi:ABC transporter I family member 11, chloroplastic-like protein [Drosera capensis]